MRPSQTRARSKAIRKTLARTCTALFMVGLSGCATINRNGGEHSVLVKSDPPGARIIANGKVLGETPAYVMLPRTRSPEIDLETTTEVQTRKLQRSYRWKASFFSNMIWLSLAPYAWLIDLVSGAAWETQDVLDAKLQGKPFAKKISSRPTRIAIAPPQADTIAISDTAARAIESKMQGRDLAKARLEVRRYDDTLPEFIAHHYDFDGKPRDHSDYRNLLHTLAVDEVLESSVHSDHLGNLTVKAQRRNIFDDQLSESFELQLRPESEIDRAFVRQNWIRRLLPNSLGIDFSNENLQVVRNDLIYAFTPVESDAWWAKGASYLTAISVSNIPERRVGRAARWQFTFVPSFRVSRKHVKLENPTLLSSREFKRWWVSGGYGGELGVQISRHYFYLNITPVLTWSELSWQRDGTDRSTTATGILGQSELGYLVFFDSNWALRAFVRSTTEDTNSWTEALDGVLPPVVNPQTPESTTISPSATMAGISISYRFDPRINTSKSESPKSRKRRPAFFE